MWGMMEDSAVQAWRVGGLARIVIGEWTYVTEAWSPAATPAPWREALAALGFEPVGAVVRRLPPLPNRSRLRVVDAPAWAGDGWERLGVFAGPEGRAFAVVEGYFDEKLLTLQTLAATGEVVETTVAPAPRQVAPPESLTATVFSGRGLRRLGRRLGGKGRDREERQRDKEVVWVRSDRPEAGFYLALVETGGRPEAEAVELLWRRHRERVARLLAGAEIPRHDSPELYLALRLRSEEVAEIFGRWLERWSRRSSYLLTLLALLTAVVLPLSIIIWGGPAAVPLPALTWVGAGLLGLMVVLLLIQPLLRRVAGHQAAQEAAPAPARELVARVRGGGQEPPRSAAE